MYHQLVRYATNQQEGLHLDANIITLFVASILCGEL